MSFQPSSDGIPANSEESSNATQTPSSATYYALVGVLAILLFLTLLGMYVYSLLKGRKTVDRDEKTGSHEVEGGSSLKDEVCGATTISC